MAEAGSTLWPGCSLCLPSFWVLLFCVSRGECQSTGYSVLANSRGAGTVPGLGPGDWSVAPCLLSGSTSGCERGLLLVDEIIT